MPRRPYFKWTISPCSVKGSRPRSAPQGSASTASRGLLPPRLTVPPRPWKKVSSTPAASARAARSDCTLYSAQREASRPEILLESE